ncbi:MAG: hypothetical protein ACK5VI_10175 [Opitutia bacterium]
MASLGFREANRIEDYRDQPVAAASNDIPEALVNLDRGLDYLDKVSDALVNRLAPILEISTSTRAGEVSAADVRSRTPLAGSIVQASDRVSIVSARLESALNRLGL